MAGGLRYEKKMIEQKMEGVVREATCWVALMMSEGYRRGEQKAHTVEVGGMKICDHTTDDEEE